MGLLIRVVGLGVMVWSAIEIGKILNQEETDAESED